MNRVRGISLRRSRARAKINLTPSPLLARIVPWVAIMLASMIPGWFVIASAPVLPPFGLLMLIAWVQLRPGVLPVWAGLPLGLFDDLFSGQPIGSGVLLWSLVVLGLEIVEARLPWRNFVIECLVAAGVISAYIIVCLGLANLAGAETALLVILPQIGVAALTYPLICRLVAMLDRLRLYPFFVIG